MAFARLKATAPLFSLPCQKLNMAKRILIIEDDAALAHALSEKLSGAGFEISISLDGESGLKNLENSRPALVLLDLVLPRKSGFEVLKAVRESDDFKNLPVLVLTNLESPYDIQRVFELGVSGYLVKANYSLDEVVQKIEKILA